MWTCIPVSGPVDDAVCLSVDEEQISKAQLRLTDIAEHLGSDWILLAEQLGISPDEIAQIQQEYHYPAEQVDYQQHH